MLKMRLIIGTLLAVALVGLLLLDDYLGREYGLSWPPSFCVIIGLAAAASLYELATLLRRRQWRVYELPTLAAVMVMLSVAVMSHVTGTRTQLGPPLGPSNPVVVILTVLVLGVITAEVVRAARHGEGLKEAIGSVGATLFMAAYVGVLMLFVVAIRFLHPIDESTHGLYLFLMFLAVVKCTDIGAYCVGKMIGRHKLVPRLSPAKTIEGCVGGYVLGMAAALGLGLTLVGLAVWQAIVFGLVVSTAAIIGDLAESLVKRAVETKDSSRAVPGFGGVLDIMDSILFAAPVAYAVLVAIGA
jgi:phosphatidate cytidylyltransferase